MNLVKDIEEHTLNELKELYKLPKTKINRMLEEQGLEIKYCGRTPYSNSLIPCNSYLRKYQDKKKRQKTNESMCSDMEKRNWPQCEIDFRKRDFPEQDYAMGALLYEQASIVSEINKMMKNRTRQNFLISILEKVKENKDWCGYHEEENYGTIPEPDKLEPILNDDMVLGYLSQRLDPISLLNLSQVLKGE